MFSLLVRKIVARVSTVILIPALLPLAALGQFYTFDVTVEAVEPGTWNPWDFSSQDVTIGFGDDNEATVTIDPGGELLAGLLFLGVGVESASGFLNIVGVTEEEEPRPAAFRQSPMSGGFETYIGYDGYGEVLVADGGVFSTRLNYTAFNPGAAGKVTITGPDSVWDVNNVTLRVGQRGHGVLHVLDGARVENISNIFWGNLSVVDDNDEIIGGGSAEILIEGGSTVIGSGGESRIGNRPSTTVEMTVRGPGSLFEMTTGYIHFSSGGNSTLLIEDGGVVRSGASFSIAAAQRANEETATGEVTLTGEGSFLDVGTWLSVGRGTFGTLAVEDGATATTGQYMRIGADVGSTGEVVVTGGDSAVNLGNYVQVGFRGNGNLVVSEGGRVAAPISGGSFSSFGRHATVVTDPDTELEETVLSRAMVLIEGPDSEIQLPRLLLGADLDFDPSGLAEVSIRDGGALTLGGLMVVRNGSTVALDGGLIELVGGLDATWPDHIDIAGEGSMISGSGIINSDLRLADGGAVTGDGLVVNGNVVMAPGGVLTGTGVDGITVNGAVTGEGEVENITFGDFTVSSSQTVPAIQASRFSAGSTLSIVVDASTIGLIDADAASDFSNANLVIAFEPFEPGTSATFPLFTGEAALNFASTSLPAGWELSDAGVLQFSGTVPVDSVFEVWASGFGLTGEDAAPNGNPAGDGFSNTQKFAFGIDPTVAVASLAGVEVAGESLTLRWNQFNGAGITYVIESRSSLANGEWTEVEGAEPVSIAGAPDGYSRFEWTVSIGLEEDRAFYRARAVVAGELLP